MGNVAGRFMKEIRITFPYIPRRKNPQTFKASSSRPSRRAVRGAAVAAGLLAAFTTTAATIGPRFSGDARGRRRQRDTAQRLGQHFRDGQHAALPAIPAMVGRLSQAIPQHKGGPVGHRLRSRHF